MNIKMRTDYSNLFNSLSSGTRSTGTTNLNFLSDYASIKNGSYGRLLKAYYAKDNDDSDSSKTSSKTSTSTSKDDAKTLAAIETSTDALKESADALLEKGSKSVFNSDKEDAVYDAVAAFVEDYNSVVETAGKSDTNSILQNTLSMVNSTKANEKMLGKVGITINKDNTLSIDKEAFKKADETTVKSMFNTNGSFAYSVSASASFINFKAETEASKANTYDFNGKFNQNYTSGSIFNSYF